MWQEALLKEVLNHPGEFNELTLYPHSPDEVEKICKCNKCGEVFVLLLRTSRQGDMKSVPVWLILEKSGIKQLKGKMNVCYREKYICTFGKVNLKPDVVNAVSHYDDYALQELENNKCVMKDCDGNIEELQIVEEQSDDDNKSTSTDQSEN